ncbi:MAG: hypothetical protein ACP6IP_01895 [Candidatus Njordarchaeia archaeon]
MALSLEKKILYSNTYCAYRETTKIGLRCRHIYSYGICDLDLCPIAQEYYANIIFQPDGIYLITKEPSEETIAGKWTKHKIEINLDNPEETINMVKEKAKQINEKNMKALLEKLEHIIQRYKFLQEKGKPIPAIEQEISLLEEEIEEAAEERKEEKEIEELKELEELEELEEEPEETEETKEETEEETEEELDLLEIDETEEKEE